MRMKITWAGVAIALLAIGCSEAPGPTGPALVGGRADGFGFEYGIYALDDGFTFEGRQPLMVAFHDVSEGVPEGYAGHFDYAVFDENEETTEYSRGFFQLYAEEGRQRILLETYDGETVGRFDWSYEGRIFRMGEASFYRLHQSDREEVVRECEAFQILHLELEEGFTTWEYPSVTVERDAEGKHEVSLGVCGWDADEATIEVGTNEAGELEARVVTEYGRQYVVQIPEGIPSRGRVLSGLEGEEPHLMANLVCHPPVAAPPEPEGPETTGFTCTTRRPEADGQTATIRFTVVDLDDREAMDLYWPDDVELPITVEPESSYAYTLVGGIADGYLTFRDGKLRLFTDQIGYEFGTLELYENSGFEHGYFRFEMMDPDHTSFYTEVDCVLD